MANERQDEAGSPSAEERPKRPPPTIDLNAADVSDDTPAMQDAKTAESSGEQAADGDSGSRPRTGGSWLRALVAPLSGALAALIVTALLLFGGLISLPQPVQPAVSPGQFDKVAADVGNLTARLTRIEANTAKVELPATDPALLARTNALEKSLGVVRDDLAALKSQAASTASTLADLKSAPAANDGNGPSSLAPLTERLARLEQTAQTLSAELAARKVSPADDANVRRLVVANTLEAALQSGGPFANVLAAAKPLTTDPALLAPLDVFAAKGIPNDTTYLREIVGILRQIASSNAPKTTGPAKAEAAKPSPDAGLLDKLQSGLSKLVRIERSDTPPAAQGDSLALVASVEASARRDDFAAVRRDLAKLPQADNPQVQGWIKSVDARDAALAAARQFSAQAMAAFTKSGQ